MKKFLFIFGILPLILISGLFWHISTSSEQVPVKKKVPGSPEWYEQFFEMKKDENGEIPLDMIRAIKQEQRAMRSRGTGNLLNVTETGPYNVGGRTRALLINKADSLHIIAGGISGGIWNSFDRGKSWTPVNDFNATLSVTGITQNPFLPNIIYYSTGESMGNSAGVAGDGVYKSTDGGMTYEKLPATSGSEFLYIWSIKASLVDTHTVFVATRRDGLFRSTDGGDSFTNVFTAGTRSINDIEVFPDSSVIITVNGDGIYRSPNGNPNTFVKLTGGLPQFDFRRIEVAYCSGSPGNMYAIYENLPGDDLLDIYKTVDSGSTWTKTTNPSKINNISFKFPWYCLTAAVSPVNPNTLIVGSVELGYTMDGGTFWAEAAPSHADYHTIVFDPFDPNKVYVGNDGGIYEYEMNTMAFFNKDLNEGYNVTQFYTGAFFPNGLDFYGGTQDNGTQSTKNAAPLFKRIYGGDGAYTQVNQQMPNVAYVSFQNGQIKRTDHAGNPEPIFYDIKFELDGNGDGDIDDGSWFINPFEINLLDGEQLYFVTKKRIWRTTNGGLSWNELTLNINKSSREPYTVGISNDTNPTIYIGGSNGLLYRIDKAATASVGSEVELTFSMSLPLRSGFISNIAVHPKYDSVAYVAFSSYSSEPRLWKLTDAKSSSPKWTNISGDLPQGLPVNWVQVHPQNDSIIVAATDFGLYTTMDGGVTWQQEQTIPNVSIHMIKLRPTDGKLFIYTHGRGIWIADMPNFKPSSVNHNEKYNNLLTIAPNPVKDILTFNFTTKTTTSFRYEIFDISGRLVLEGEANQRIDVMHIKKGIYFLRLSGEGKQMAVRRFIKV